MLIYEQIALRFIVCGSMNCSIQSLATSSDTSYYFDPNKKWIIQRQYNTIQYNDMMINEQ
jgi:hypothetical protein